MISSAFQTCEMRAVWKRRSTSLQLAGVALVALHDLPHLLPLQRRVQHLVQPRVALPPVDEVHELVQGDEGFPLGAAAAEKTAAFEAPEGKLKVTKKKTKEGRGYLSSKMLWISGRRHRLFRKFWKASQVKSSGFSPSD